MTNNEAAAALNTIVVPGTGRVVVEPDIASIRLGIVVTRPTASAARESAAETMAAILQAVGAAGVARRDIRTSLLGLNAVMDYSQERGPQVTGYQVTNSVEVTVRDVEAAGRVIDAGLAAGATSLDGLEFRLADPAPAEDLARKAAVADARSRAEALAAAGNLRLGPVHGIVEGGHPPAMPFERGGIAGMELKAADTPVESGTLEIAVSVVVTYRIAD